MSKVAMGTSAEKNLRNRRLGVALTALILTYIAAVVAFLILK